MRPERLILKGFGAFRTFTEIDFSGVELFALTGPTGSGKTTILDGVCFALYGAVPRQPHVAPVVSQGLLEAVVALEFTVGEEKLRVARHVRKDARRGTANTDEASLESNGAVVATGADDVTASVATLLGLDFNQFTTCVLLPQGEFQRFLHDKPANRQNLLSALLDLGIYERIGQLAGQRQQLAAGQLKMIEQRLSAITGIDDQSERVAREGLHGLESALATFDAARRQLEADQKEESAAAADVDNHHRLLSAIDALRPPDGLEVLSERRRVVDTAATEIADLRTAAETELEVAAAELSRLPSRQELNRWSEAWSALERDTIELASASVTEADAQVRALQATADLDRARERFTKASDDHRAAHLRQALRAGEPCPVCDQVVSSPPPSLGVPELDGAQVDMSVAEESRHRKHNALAAATAERIKVDARLGELNRQVADAPSRPELEVAEVELANAEERRLAASERVDQLRTRQREARDEAEALTSRERQARQLIQAARDRVSSLEPPTLALDDPSEDWDVLIRWAADERTKLDRLIKEGRAKVSELATRRKEWHESFLERLSSLGLTSTVLRLRDDLVEAVALRRVQLKQIETFRIEARHLEKQQEASSSEQEVAALLVKLLRNDAFRNWLLDEVFAALVSGANLRLADLTRGQYSLAMAGRDFEVIDNLSAGHHRSVRTLSGGETFLVSLALALALADLVAETATTPARLESIFLDEGFGTLDAETLDVVSSVIAELGAEGKTVGIVTHVAELAEQMPVRYHVGRAKDGASVKRVDA
ncbi:MAG: AAA family ATPase [Actinomycetota bacterium]